MTDSSDDGSTEPIYGVASRGLHLPFFKAFNIPVKDPSEYPLNPNMITESCGFKVITGGVIGGVLGIALGVFMGAMGDSSPVQILHGREVPTAPLREQLRVAMKATAGKSRSWAKSFGVLSALFGGVECLIEKQRAKHDVWNPVMSGCVVGATLSAKAGPAAACTGCVGFAGFSYIMDKVMGQH